MATRARSAPLQPRAARRSGIAGQGGAGTDNCPRRPRHGVAYRFEELKAAELQSRLMARIRSFDFGAKDVDTMIVT
jgi:hypothetical protein